MTPLPRLFLLCSLSLMLTACAIQQNGKGGYSFGVDTAALFGTEIGQFTLQNGSEGTLRRENKNYSVKLSRYQRVIPLPNIDNARIARVESIGTRTVVVIETQRGSCNYRYKVLAIDGANVDSWDLGNCNDRPIVLALDDHSAMAFDFPKGKQIERFVYTQDGRMLRGMDNPAPNLNVLAKPFADENLMPAASLQAVRQAEPARQTRSKTSGGAGKKAGSAPTQPVTAPATTSTADSGGRFNPAPPQRSGDSQQASTPAVAAAPNARRPQASAKLDLPTEEIASTRLDLRD